MRLDDRDRRILTSLQEDSRMSNADLAEAVGMSASALWRRVRSLEEAGVIKRYGAVVVPQAMGLNFEALVQVNLTRHAPEHLQEFIRAVEGNSHVVECYATTGQADYHLRILAPDLEAYNQFLEQFLFQLAGVASAQTHVILKTVKRDTPVVP